MVLIMPADRVARPRDVVRRRARDRLSGSTGSCPSWWTCSSSPWSPGWASPARCSSRPSASKDRWATSSASRFRSSPWACRRTQVLANMLARSDTPSMRSFVRSVRQGEALGVSIGEIIRELALEMRNRRRSAAEERAQKAPIKILFPLVLLIFPAIFVVLLAPAMFKLLDAIGGGSSVPGSSAALFALVHRRHHYVTLIESVWRGGRRLTRCGRGWSWGSGSSRPRSWRRSPLRPRASAISASNAGGDCHRGMHPRDRPGAVALKGPEHLPCRCRCSSRGK